MNIFTRYDQSSMKYILITLAYFFPVTLLAQDLTCADFRNGTFLLPAGTESEEDFLITRKRNKQLEVGADSAENFIDLVFIDDCNYTMKKNPKSGNFDEMDQMLNENGGVHVETIKISNDTLYFLSYAIINGERMENKGCMVKLK